MNPDIDNLIEQTLLSGLSKDSLVKFKARLTQLLVQERIEELENFEWNDAHLYVHKRLEELRSQLNKEDR